MYGEQAGARDRFDASGHRSICGFFQCPVKLYMPNLIFDCILSCNGIRPDFPAIDTTQPTNLT